MAKIKHLLFLLIKLGYYAVAAYGLFLILVWWNDVETPIAFGEQTVSKQQVKPGDSVVFTQVLTKKRLCIGEVNRWLEGSCGFKQISENNAVLSTGSHVVTIPVMIPTNFLEGSCQFRSRHYYICNPLDWIFNRKIYYSTPIEFKVVK